MSSVADGSTLLDADDAADIIPAHIETNSELNEWEQANILEAIVWLHQRPAGDSVLTLAFLRELHRQMFDKTWRWAGMFRTRETNIGVAASAIQEGLKNLLDDTRYQIEQKGFSDESAARFHHRLVTIHPFPNGNGRHARLMTEALQSQVGAPHFTWGRVRLDGEGKARTAYLAALRAADGGDFRKLFAFVRS